MHACGDAEKYKFMEQNSVIFAFSAVISVSNTLLGYYRNLLVALNLKKNDALIIIDKGIFLRNFLDGDIGY